MAKIDDVINTLSPDELQILNSDPKLLSDFKAKYGEEKIPLIKQAWDALAVPGDKLKQKFDLVANAVNVANQNVPQSGNLTKDLIKGIPRIAGSTVTDIMANTIPSSISREAMVTAGALQAAQEAAPIAKMIGKGVGSQIESLAGAAPGALETAYKDSTLIGASGKKAAGALYETAKEVGGGIREELANIGNKKDFIDKAAEIAAKGELTPSEGLAARQELDAAKKTLTGTYYRAKRLIFDEVAKQAYSGADQAFKRGVQADSIRQIFPQNKYGGASAFKMGIIAGLQAMGTPGKIAGAFLSPAAAGVASTGAGILERNVISPMVNNPAISAIASAALDRLAQARKRNR